MSENHSYNLLDKLQELEVRLCKERKQRDKAKAMIHTAVNLNRKMTEIEDIQEMLDLANNAIACTTTAINRIMRQIKRQK
jgi:hypothetical protein